MTNINPSTRYNIGQKSYRPATNITNSNSASMPPNNTLPTGAETFYQDVKIKSAKAPLEKITPGPTEKITVKPTGEITLGLTNNPSVSSSTAPSNIDEIDEDYIIELYNKLKEKAEKNLEKLENAYTATDEYKRYETALKEFNQILQNAYKDGVVTEEENKLIEEAKKEKEDASDAMGKTKEYKAYSKAEENYNKKYGNSDNNDD